MSGSRSLLTDVARIREETRLRRLRWIVVVLAGVLAFLVYKAVTGWGPVDITWPDPMYIMIFLFFLVLLAFLVGSTVIAGRSPHIVYLPGQIPVRLDHVKGVGPVKEDVERSMELLLGARTFRTTMGGTPRRGVLFEGPPGTGKTMMAKAMAAEAGVPFYFVSGTSFQSMYYGATARKIRSYFKALRKAARREGAVIGFIEEIDAIAMTRAGMAMTPHPAHARAGDTRVERVVSEGVGGVVNELLVQMQSFDEPTGGQKALSWWVDKVNLLLPAHRAIPRPRPTPVDVLIIAATNRADALDPALLRPGRFDRTLTFDLPDKAGRIEIIEFYLGRKSHDRQLDDPEYVEALAGVTQGYSPVMIENLLDEGLVNALRRGSDTMNWADIERARIVLEVGLGTPVGYTERERRRIATHEAGHATVAFLETDRRLEILTIIKRSNALGLLAHGDADEVFTRTKGELTKMIRIAFGGLVSEELFFDDVSNGPSGDLQSATTMAAHMVGAAGMGDSWVSLAAIEGSSLGGGLVSHVLADERARQSVEVLLDEQYRYVTRLIQDNRHLVEALRDALLERHELIGSEITDVLRAARTGRPTAVPDDRDVLVIDLREPGRRIAES